jgi:agmatinase
MAHIVCFPFDLFGNAGCGDGARLLSDVVREIVDDTAQETRTTRAHGYANTLVIEDVDFETIESLDQWKKHGERVFKFATKQSDFTLWLGGNHLSVMPVYESLKPTDLVVQFDAHLDIFDLHDTKETLSHGNFIKHLKSRPKIINLGHRDLLIPTEDIEKYYQIATPAYSANAEMDRWFPLAMQNTKRIWLDIDADVFDPAYCPAVHQRSPGGFSLDRMLMLLEIFMMSGKVIGCSISEFDPGRDRDEQSLNLLGWLVEWLLVTQSEMRTSL